MINLRLSSIIKLLVTVFTVSIFVETVNSQEAFARAGSGRSSGRSFGSFRRSSPPPNNNYYRGAQPTSAPSHQPQRGGFLRGLAGGIAGGFLGSMLFSSMGHAAGVGGMGGGGGMGFLEILLLGGAAFFFYRWWRGRQQQQEQQPIMAYSATQPSQGYRPQNMSSWQQEQLPASGINPDDASDIFFRVQGAWTRRDLTSVNGLLGADIARVFAADIAELKSRRQINRLENITVRQTEVLDTWHEDGADHSRVRFVANLLDYVVDEQSGRVVDGNDSVPVKFEENWIFARMGSGWQLVGIDQV